MCDIIYINLPETGEPGHTLLTVRLWDINKSPRPESCAGAELDLGNEESPRRKQILGVTLVLFCEDKGVGNHAGCCGDYASWSR